MLWISFSYFVLLVNSLVNARPNQDDLQNLHSGKLNNTVCGSGFFQCDLNSCISDRFVCDGDVDCPNESDEEDSLCFKDKRELHDRQKRSDFFSFVESLVPEGESSCTVSHPPHGSFKLLGSSSKYIVDDSKTIVSKGSLLNVVCEDGYKADGVTTFVCGADNMHQSTRCKKACPPLQEPTLDITCKLRGRIIPCDEPVLPGTDARFNCKYLHVAKMVDGSQPNYQEAHCSEEGQWNVPLHSCVPDGCVLPLQPEHGHYTFEEGQLTGANSVVPAGTFLKVICDQGYKLLGRNAYHCRYQQWNNPPECVKTCDPLISSSLAIKCTRDGEIVPCDEEMLPNTVASIGCKHSFTIETRPDYNSIKCQEDGKWNAPLYSCIPEGCTAPQKIVNGKFHISGEKSSFIMLDGNIIVPVGSFLDIKCNRGYKLDGPNGNPCRDQSWGPISKCLKTCKPLQRPSLKITCTRNGLLVDCNQEMLPGTRAKLECNLSYSRNHIDYKSVFCLDEGEWNQPLYSCNADCGQENPQVTPVVVGGGDAEFGLYPWHVGLYRYYGSIIGYANMCGGSLITPKIVLTAAHCFKNEFNVNLYRVAAGILYREWQHENDTEAQTREITEIIIGPRFEGQSNYFFDDIAMIIVKDLFTLTSVVLPVCLNWKVVVQERLESHGTMAQVSGWGYTTASSTPSEKLKTLSIPIVDYDTCKNESPDFVKYLSNKICAGRSDGQNVCNGDSGGGLTVKWNGVHYIVGLVSVIKEKDKNCDIDKFAVFTQVSSYRNWLEPYINKYHVL